MIIEPNRHRAPAHIQELIVPGCSMPATASISREVSGGADERETPIREAIRIQPRRRAGSELMPPILGRGGRPQL
jgi:hypothetical protein